MSAPLDSLEEATPDLPGNAASGLCLGHLPCGGPTGIGSYPPKRKEMKKISEAARDLRYVRMNSSLARGLLKFAAARPGVSRPDT
jgi:hypothetical protein